MPKKSSKKTAPPTPSKPANDAPKGSTKPSADPSTLPDTWSRIMITSVAPSVEGGRWAIKRTPDEPVDVTAGIVVDSHEAMHIQVVVATEDGDLQTHWMQPAGNDEYTASFSVDTVGLHHYKVHAWLDRFGTWQDAFHRRVEGGVSDEELESELLDGASIVDKAVANATKDDRKELKALAKAFRNGDTEAALGEDVAELVRTYAPRDMEVTSTAFPLRVDPEVARTGAWYEFFPRSAGENGEHATLDDAAERLPRIKEMGYDIVYLPPVHPIGKTNRKGKDNAPTAQDGDPGSPWAIGGFLEDGSKGGHKSVHPRLGGIDAFDRFVERAKDEGLEVAIDIAFQASPDHPYVEEHPEWFTHRPDGSIRYAENPPKKYQDVHPINFESDEWPALWQELKSVFEYWIDHGITIFRVDNPHTKPFAFWEWCLRELRKETPELIVLSEAFTKPKTMYGLAKLGFNNSYTYFTWRNTKEELTEYAREVCQSDVAEFFRPNFWPNTPDILHDELATGGRAKHMARFVLAATLSSVYGVYGPPYEHVFNHQHPDREEYAQNEKYEVRSWNWNDPSSLQPFMARVNAIRKTNPALQQLRNVEFLETKNPHLLAYSKETSDNAVIVVVSLDPHHTQEGQLVTPTGALDLPDDGPYTVHDLLNDARYSWTGSHHYLRLSPDAPAHIFRLPKGSDDASPHAVFDRPVHE